MISIKRSFLTNKRLMQSSVVPVLSIAIILGVSTIASTHNVFAHESNSKRYNDGYNNGYSAAQQDNNYNPTCDPNGQYTSDGQHTTIYCTGWSNGYQAGWNNSHNGNGGNGNSGQQGGFSQNGNYGQSFNGGSPGNGGGSLLNKGIDYCKHNLVSCLTIGKSLLGLLG